MPPLSIPTVLQLVVGLGLLNVWLIRANASTAYRGGTAQSLKEEFAEYGLPEWMFLLVGALKIVAGIALIVGLWMPRLVLPAAGVVVVLMVGALTMHVKVKDPWIKSLPAFLMLLMSAGILLLR
jgi:uncharacterized membrane protein YphA (DoxX/SURF4 family)